MSKMKIAVICALGAIVPSLPAHSANAVTWESNAANSSEQIYASTSDTSALTFVCSNGKLSSAISIADNNGKTILENLFGSRRTKSTEVTLYVNGEEANTSKWTYNIRGKVFTPQKRIVTAKLYNAAVRGDSVSIQRKGEDQIELTLPAATGNFTSFGGACGVGTNMVETKADKQADEPSAIRDNSEQKPPPF